MMETSHISSTLMVFQLAVLIAVLLACARVRKLHPVTKLLYLMWIATMFLSNLYYLAHVLQNKGLYLPFSAMDIVTAGLYTLLPAALQNNFSIELKKITVIGIAGALFGAVNVWLWILWSGSLLGNLLNALPFIYFIFICARSLEESRALGRTEGICLLTAAAAISALESVLYYTDGKLYTVLDIISYIMMFSCCLYLIFKTTDTVRNGSADRALALSAFAYATSIATVYMSYEPIYFVAELLALASVVLTCLSVIKKGREAEG